MANPYCVRAERSRLSLLLNNRGALQPGFEPWPAGEAPTIDEGIDAAVQIVGVSPKMNEEAVRVALEKHNDQPDKIIFIVTILD